VPYGVAAIPKPAMIAIPRTAVDFDKGIEVFPVAAASFPLRPRMQLPTTHNPFCSSQCRIGMPD
jgi:hypothetical protein